MDESISRSILEEIRKVREEKKISRKEFSKMLGMPERTYTAIEMGETTKIPAELILKGCIFLEIDLIRFTDPAKYKETEEKLSQKRVIQSMDKIDEIYNWMQEFKPLMESYKKLLAEQRQKTK
ncbi:MAG: helix-turn-helix transcriptional regulator [Bacteroidia bacterium]|nr:helix-turn-helix transcriptional regulator [Bacteroidia bacterium]